MKLKTNEQKVFFGALLFLIIVIVIFLANGLLAPKRQYYPPYNLKIEYDGHYLTFHNYQMPKIIVEVTYFKDVNGKTYFSDFDYAANDYENHIEVYQNKSTVKAINKLGFFHYSDGYPQKKVNYNHNTDTLNFLDCSFKIYNEKGDLVDNNVSHTFSQNLTLIKK